jgi:hypothetical protein
MAVTWYLEVLLKSVDAFQVWLKSDKNNWLFTSRPHTYVSVLGSDSWESPTKRTIRESLTKMFSLCQTGTRRWRQYVPSKYYYHNPEDNDHHFLFNAAYHLHAWKLSLVVCVWHFVLVQRVGGGRLNIRDSELQPWQSSDEGRELEPLHGFPAVEAADSYRHKWHKAHAPTSLCFAVQCSAVRLWVSLH